MGRMTCGNRAKRVSGVGVPVSKCAGEFSRTLQAGFSLAPQVTEGTALGPVPPPPSLQVFELLGPGVGMLGLLGGFL